MVDHLQNHLNFLEELIIKHEIILNKENKTTKIKLTIFFSTIEDITKVIEVKKEEIIDNY